MVTDPTAPGGPPPEIAGELLLDDPDLRVVALADVDERDIPTGWLAGDGGRWLAFLVPLGVLAVLDVLDHRVAGLLATVCHA